MNLREVRKLASDKLLEAGIDRPWFEADLLICSITGMERILLLAHPDRPFPEHLIPTLKAAIERRAAREPLQYITGVCEFMGRAFRVGPGCLVPRPETELLVAESRKHFKGGVFLDWGTGSGCIAASILLDNPASRCVAVDKLSRRNNLGMEEPQGEEPSWEMSSLPLPFPREDPRSAPGFEMIVSNPPYIPSAQIPDLMPEVERYEPRSALDGGEDGFDHYRSLAGWARRPLCLEVC